MAIFHFLKYWLFGMSVFYCLISPFHIPDFAKNFFSKLVFEQAQQWFFIASVFVLSLYMAISSIHKLAIYCSAKKLFEQEKEWLNFE